MNKNKIFGGLFALSLGVVALASCNNAQPATTLYTVKFVSDGTCVSKQRLEAGATITAPTSPKDYETDKATYTFNGWYDNNDGSKKFEPGTTATKDVTYEAKFDEKVKDYVVTFVYNDGETATVTKKYGDKVYPSDVAEPEGYVKDHFNYDFDAWYSDGVSLDQDGATVLGDKEYTAEYVLGDPVEYTAKFYVDGKYVEKADKVVTATKLLCAQPKFKYRDGYRYTWTDETGDIVYATADGDEDFKYARFDVKKLPDEACDFNVYLKEEALVCTVNFWDKAGDTDPVYTVDVSVGDVVTAPDITCESYMKGTWVNTLDPTDYFEPNETYPFKAEDIVPELNYVKTLTEKVNTVTFSKGQGTPDTRQFQHSDLEITAPKCDDPTPGYAKNVWYDATNNITIDSEGTHTFTDADVTKTFAFVQTGVGNEYTITFNPNGGTMEGGATTQKVTFGKPYTLTNVTNNPFDLEKWTYVNEAGKTVEVPSSGTWNIPSNVTLKANWWVSFENDTATVSAVVGNKSTGVGNVEIVNGGSLRTGKALKYTLNRANDDGIQIKKELMDKMFADPNVVGVNFDAKSSERGNNWRHRSHVEGVTPDPTNKIYENGNSNCGIETHWKTFQYLRKYYVVDYSNEYVDKTYTMWSANSNGREIYIDNIKPVYKNVDILGFESGAYTNKNSSDPIDNSDWRTGFDDSATLSQAILLEGNQSGVKRYTDSLEHDIVSEGNTSWKIVKTGNYIRIKIDKNRFMSGLPEDTKVSVDLYSTVALNSNPTTAILTGPDNGPLGGAGYAHPANRWVTYEFTVSQFTGNPWAQIFNIGGSPMPTIYIDNIVIHA